MRRKKFKKTIDISSRRYIINIESQEKTFGGTKMTLQQKLLAYYKQNKEDFDHDIEELDEFNGYLCDNRCHPMEELDDLYDGFDPLSLSNPSSSLCIVAYLS